MSRTYRTIAPAEQPPPIASGVGHSEERPVGRRRVRTGGLCACSRCRTKKRACDGNRPSCAECVKWGTKCVYDVDTRALVRKRQQEYVEIIDRLTASDESEAMDILHRLRAGIDLTTILASAEGSMPSERQPTDLRAAKAVSTPTSPAVEAEQSVRHQIAYSALLPLDHLSLDLNSPQNSPGLPVSQNGSYLPPWKHDTRITLPGAPGSFEHAGGGGGLDFSTPATPLNSAVEGGALSSFGSPRALNYIDRLQRLNIAYWTSVPISDAFAAAAISKYLQISHPVFGFFDANLFLDDLVEQRLEFCSPFLVNALLTFAVYAFSRNDPSASAQTDELLRQTVRLWRAGRSCDHVLNVAAMSILCFTCHVNNSELSITELCEEIRTMGERMHLFGVKHEAQNAGQFSELSTKTKRFYAHVAWGAYNWITVNASYCPAMPTISPPMLPIPRCTQFKVCDGTLTIK